MQTYTELKTFKAVGEQCHIKGCKGTVVTKANLADPFDVQCLSCKHKFYNNEFCSHAFVKKEDFPDMDFEGITHLIDRFNQEEVRSLKVFDHCLDCGTRINEDDVDAVKSMITKRLNEF